MTFKHGRNQNLEKKMAMKVMMKHKKDVYMKYQIEEKMSLSLYIYIYV